MAALQGSLLGRGGNVTKYNSRPTRGAVLVTRASAQTAQAVGVKEVGTFTVRGTARKVNEDRFDASAAPAGPLLAYAAAYDGHGGAAVAEWLAANLRGAIAGKFDAKRPEAAVAEAFLAADKELLSARTGFLGMGERGVGGAKCGATAAVACVYAAPNGGGAARLLAANVGDARTLLIRGGEAVELSEEHVPDKESERVRIEANNPNPKMPMVRYIGGTWRVGGLLALSRAFGDAYLKGSLQFEGVGAGGFNNYSSGFGLVAEPYTVDVELTAADTHVVIASDGLFAEEARGGGGGLDNAAVAELCQTGASCAELAKTMSLAAQKVGSTDDVTVVVLRLG